jgi:hypothetical protein
MEGGDTVFHDKKRYERISEICTDFLDAVKTNRDDPFPTLDSIFSNLVAFKLSPELSEETITERAHDLLRRMPDQPLSLAEIEPEFCSKYVLVDKSQQRTNMIFFHSNEWNSLSVVNQPSTNTIRMAIAVAADIFWGPDLPVRRTERPLIRQSLVDASDWQPDFFAEYISGISQLLEEVTRRGGECSSYSDKQQWFIVKTFLWTSFQRGVLLLQW